jgi:hypothetical protein
MKFSFKVCCFTVVSFISLGVMADTIVVTGYQATPGNTGAGVSVGDPTPGVGSYDMSQGSRGVASQKASCQNALNGFDKKFGDCYQGTLDFEINYIGESARKNLPKDQAIYDSDVLIGGKLAGSKILTCKNDYNSSINSLNAGGCAGLVSATAKPIP